MKLLLKNTFKKIKKSFGRFLSILFIVALGISVFIGLRESTAGMLYTADNYYDEYNLMDFKIVSTYGLDDGDVAALKELEDAYKVIPSYSVDVISDGESIRIHAIEEDVNNVTLVSGRMPENDNECVADYSKYDIGDNITFDSDNLSISSCEVVGTIKSVLYIRDEKGISSVGNGKLISFVYVNKDVFNLEYYTEIYLIAKGSKETNSYYDDYTEQIAALQSELEELKPIRETIRYEEILTEANNEIIAIKEELNDKIESATGELESSKEELDTASKTLAEERSSTELEFISNLDSLNDSKNDIITNLETIGTTEEELDTYIDNLYNNIELLTEELSVLDKDSDEYTALNGELTNLNETYNNLLIMQEELNAINNNLYNINESYEVYETEIENQEAEIEAGYEEYYNGLEELETAKAEAEEKIAEAKAQLDDIEKPVWYLLDRTDNSGYVNYEEDVIKVDAIAKILPIFFVIVVVLMVLNTLTRLIEEERTEIGILQSNGFSKNNITITYLIYVCLAGLIGIALGMTIGYSLIPQVIYGVFLSRYYVPKLITIVSPLPFSLVIGVTLIIMIFVTIFACRKELKEVPASLLRPKAPKSGKKIIFEKISFIWSKLNFMWKVTLRNLFRYKKRIIMTILGVAGCTALLVTGLGLNDSINTVADLQYNNIIKYDAMYILDNDVTSVSDDLVNIFNENDIENSLLIKQDAYTYTYDNKVSDVYLIVPSDIDSFSDYVNLTSTTTGNIVTIPDDGVIITQQTADNLNVTSGDVISIRNDDNELYLLYVTDVVENYVSHYIYMSEEYYEEIFNEDITYNTIITDGIVDESETLTDYNILTVSYTNDILDSFDSFISGLNKIIIMIVVFACFLALIVLYNLTIINVS
ncbi:MAG TPA: FtsX-like permease family protein, partial [Bacilli bacterium]|nr:FtsX-like permease family protein [Bacilli bacterium]